MQDYPENNEWLIYDLSDSLKPIGFRLTNSKLGFYEYKDEAGNEATLSLGVIGGATIYLSGPQVTLKNQRVYDLLDDLYKKGCRSDKGTYFSHKLPQFNQDGDVKWGFTFGEDDKNEATTIDLSGYLKSKIIPLIERWGRNKLIQEDIDLLKKENDAEYSLVSNVFLGGKFKEAGEMANEYLPLSKDKDVYQKFIDEIFGYKKRSLPMISS
ncbi:MAG: hypothetical protein IPG59_18430 [Candidatus Melainabacteria bacterium]|nr:MAG: hypothetical protein IPG59_18430 [Candidatus Melainabacteria bacterium]